MQGPVPPWGRMREGEGEGRRGEAGPIRSPGTTAPWQQAVGFVQNKQKSQTQNIFEGMKSADKMQLLCSKEHAEARGFLPRSCGPSLHPWPDWLPVRSPSAPLSPGEAQGGGAERAAAGELEHTLHSARKVVPPALPAPPPPQQSFLSVPPAASAPPPPPLPTGFRLLGARAQDLI